jgi:hypothetical protein
MKKTLAVALTLLFAIASAFSASTPAELRTGVADYAFDHLGSMSNLAGVCVAADVNIIYTGQIGEFGYNGLPAPEKLAVGKRLQQEYLKRAKKEGIRLAIGYVCATSIVKLKSFDTNWTPEFRARFRTPPADWRQVDKRGTVLRSWYDAPYEPACMNNPDWRTYEKFMVGLQLECGCDGIFFDNPTVHPDGCYCPFCMAKFDTFLAANSRLPQPAEHSVEALREWAGKHTREFMEFRATIAEDFLADMRRYARTVKPDALITCNNSLNTPDALFLQCRTMGYNINTMSASEDFITIEDMATLPGKRADGRVVEYGPIYKMLHAICHDKPIVACTLADADYYDTLPGLARLSMAEAAANDASWLLWPGWQKDVAESKAAAIRPEADFLRRNEKLLNHTEPRCDVLLYLPFRRWLDSDHCAAATLASALQQANIQFAVHSEEGLDWAVNADNPRPLVVLTESLSYLEENDPAAAEVFTNFGKVISAENGDWLKQVREAVSRPSITVHGPSTLRAVVRDQKDRVVVHLYNLNVERFSGKAEKVYPATNIGLDVRVPFRKVGTVRALTADAYGTQGPLEFTSEPDSHDTIAHFTVPTLGISSILVLEP